MSNSNARLVDLLLGPGAAAPHKLEVGNPIVTLGVETSISASGVTFKVNPAKAEEWTSQIQTYLQMGMLTSGEASKLAGEFSCCALPSTCTSKRLESGRLGFASQHIFHRLGRALLVPVYKQIRSRSSSIGKELRMALLWWCNALQKGMSQASCRCPAEA